MNITTRVLPDGQLRIEIKSVVRQRIIIRMYSDGSFVDITTWNLSQGSNVMDHKRFASFTGLIHIDIVDSSSNIIYLPAEILRPELTPVFAMA